jgi:hypothetical protein
MIIGFVEDGEVRVYDDLSQAMEEWARFPEDLLSDVIVLYDDDGAWLKPVPSYAPRTWFPWRRKLLSVDMVRAVKDGDQQDSLGYLLSHEAASLAPNHLVSSLEELRLKFAPAVG